jgi:cytidylate kinase
MTVIAMTREMGTLGKDVAAGVAEKLNLDVVHSELIAQRVGKRLGIEESAAYRYLEGSSTQMDRWRVGRRRFLQGTVKELIDLALQDNVIIRGWGAAQLFNKTRDIACVRVCAPMEFRVEEMLNRLNSAATEASAPINKIPEFVRSSLYVSSDAARREIEQNDAEHARFVTRTFATDWREPIHYDLVLNTGRISVEECILQITRLLESTRYQNPDNLKVALNVRQAELE